MRARKLLMPGTTEKPKVRNIPERPATRGHGSWSPEGGANLVLGEPVVGEVVLV